MLDKFGVGVLGWDLVALRPICYGSLLWSFFQGAERSWYGAAAQCDHGGLSWTFVLFSPSISRQSLLA